MPCYHPLTGWKTGDRLIFKYRPGIGLGGSITVPCGQCIGCKLERSRQWAVRCMHEKQLHESNCFLNLTYRDENLPDSLERKDFQDFMKRLRFHRGCFDLTLWSHTPRYMMCGEYGERTLRPHYHAVIFGLDFPDKYYWKKSPSGFPLYRSNELETLWTMGDSTIGDVTFESAAYVARYVTKKITGDAATKHYERVDPETGEITAVKPEFNGMSLKPAIGKQWIEKYITDVFPHDHVIMNGHEAKPPRYYDKLLKEKNENLYEQIKERRKEKSKEQEFDNTKARLEVKEQVAIAKLNLKKRTLE